MKLRFYFFFLMFPAMSAVGSCALDIYFEKSSEYYQKKLDNLNNKLSYKENNLTLLPSLSIGSGQYSSNDNNFKGLTSSSLSLSLSNELYAGNRYGKTKKKLEVIDKINKISLNEKRNAFYLNLLLALSDYKYLNDQRVILYKRLAYQEILTSKSELDYKLGRISKLDLSLNKLKLEQINLEINKIDNQIKKNEIEIQSDYKIPAQLIMNINGHDLLLCKTTSNSDLLNERYQAEHERNKIDYELAQTALYPSIHFSLSMSPPGQGHINDFRIKKAEYNASVNISASLSSLFMNSITKERSYIDFLNTGLKKDDELKSLIKRKNEILNEIENISNELHFLSEDIKVKKASVDYFHGRYIQKEGTIQSFYSQLEQYTSAEVYLKKKERELEYYKIYFSFID